MLRRRGVEVRTGQSVATALDGCWVQLSTGEKVATHSLIWCVGVRADPLVTGLDLDTNRGRLVVDEFMSVPGAPDIYACGDCAAVPDLTRPGQICGMTAQHAQRQGKQIARNVAASLGTGKARPYEHHDLGFLVDLGGLAAAANPLNVPLSGPPANGHPSAGPAAAHGWPGRLRQGVAEMAARGDAELGEDVAQVVLDRARTEE